jgi:flagellar hook protein FlgE
VPSIANGLFAGRAGIAAHGTAIGVLGDNIANANSTGFKASRADFSDLLAGNLGGGSGGITVGSGAQVKSVKPVFTQGTLEFTGRGLDNAIDGAGFFVVEDTGGGRSYTRAGNFQLSKTGELLDQNGFNVMGFPATKQGIQPLSVQNITQSEIKSTAVKITGNLDAGANGQLFTSFWDASTGSVLTTNTGTPAGVTTIPAFTTFSTLNNSADFQVPVNVFDSLGGSHPVNLFFFRDRNFAPTATPDVATRWMVRAYVDGAELRNGTPSAPVQLGGDGFMTFDSDGTRVTPIAGASVITNAQLPIEVTPNRFRWANGAPSDEIDFNLEPFTSFNNKSLVNSLSQDGKGAGNVVSFSIQADGSLFAQLDNGTTTSIGRLAMANFANPEALDRRGNALYVQSSTSGDPVIGRPQSGQFGAIQAGALELSTTDIASDFIKLISLQRGFQGSSRIITSINELLNDVINLAR